MKSILNAHPFFQLLWPLTSVFGCRWSHTIICTYFSVWCFLCFCHFLEKTFAELFHMYLQRMAQNTFLACKLIVHTLLPELNPRIFDKKRRIAMSKEQMAKHYDYEMKDKVVLEEEASWVRLCSKLVSNNIYIKNRKKIVKNCKWKKSIEVHAYYTPHPTTYFRDTRNTHHAEIWYMLPYFPKIFLRCHRMRLWGWQPQQQQRLVWM